MSGMSDHYVYVIASVVGGKLDKPVKIGITGNWQSRIRQVQTGSPVPVKYAWVFNLPNVKIARSVEEAFHTVMKRQRLSGEWFDIPALAAVELMAKNIKIAIDANLAAWTPDERALAVEMTRADEALQMVDRVKASHGAAG